MRVSCTISGKPVPCPRPRVGRHGTYMPAEYKAWKAEAITAIQQANIKQNGNRPILGPVEVSLKLYGYHGSTDIDNCAKSCLDAMQLAGVIENDKNVMHLDVWKMPKEGEPRTEVEIVSLTR